MAKKKANPDNGTGDSVQAHEPKSPRRISLDLPDSVSAECAAVAASTGLQESKVRELVRVVALDAASHVATDVRSIVKAHLTAALG